MTNEEILRRLGALMEMKPGTRPVTLFTLGRLAGIKPSNLMAIVKEQRTMHEPTRIRLSRALQWVENDQVVKKQNRTRKRDLITIRPPQPPQKIISKVELSPAGPKMRFLALNPNQFPPMLKK